MSIESIREAHPHLVDRLGALLTVNQWALWATLYVDSSNAGPERLGGRLWAWGARGRIDDATAALFGVDVTFKAAGPSPLAPAGCSSNVAELWGIAYAVQDALRRWPFLAGLGVRCDSLAAVGAVAGCDGRRNAQRGRWCKHTLAARAHLTNTLTSAGTRPRDAHARAWSGRARQDTHLQQPRRPPRARGGDSIERSE